jgi:subtilisin-like proprotein convertase family protein
VTAAGTHTAGSLGTLSSVNVTAAIGTTTIPDNTITGLSKTFSISGLTTVEQAELTLYVGSGYLPYCNQIELTSPSGTKSIVFNMDSAHTSASTSGIRLLSNAFYGETAAGTWTLKVINRCSTPAQTLSTTTGQKLTIRGR